MTNAFNPGSPSENSYILALREGTWFILFTLILIISSTFLGFIYNQPHLVTFSLYSKSFLDITGVVILLLMAAYLAHITFLTETESLAAKVSDDIRAYIFNPYYAVSVLLVFIAFPLIVSSLTILKTLLPFIVPYYLDNIFMELDRGLHFGIAPWEAIQPLVGYPYITFAINVVYNFWFFMQLIIVIWQMFSLGRPKLRMQFLITYVLIWLILGSLLAILLASAGPCFYSNITHLPDPYSPLFQYLHSANELLAENGLSLWALDTQSYLWEHFVESSVGLGSGISAMPSLHVAVAFLLALVGWRVNKTLGIFLSLHAFIIVIGSVHLGWHYAIDGYVSIIGTLLIWKFSGYLVRNIPERRIPVVGIPA